MSVKNFVYAVALVCIGQTSPPANTGRNGAFSAQVPVCGFFGFIDL